MQLEMRRVGVRRRANPGAQVEIGNAENKNRVIHSGGAPANQMRNLRCPVCRFAVADNWAANRGKTERCRDQRTDGKSLDAHVDETRTRLSWCGAEATRRQCGNLDLRRGRCAFPITTGGGPNLDFQKNPKTRLDTAKLYFPNVAVDAPHAARIRFAAKNPVRNIGLFVSERGICSFPLRWFFDREIPRGRGKAPNGPAMSSKNGVKSWGIWATVGRNGENTSLPSPALPRESCCGV